MQRKQGWESFLGECLKQNGITDNAQFGFCMGTVFYVINLGRLLVYAIYSIRTCSCVSMQRPGSEAIRTQIQPSKPTRDITKITNL